ncbi:hypothetical protein FHS28_001300 [Roseateles terrae]|uniref:Uncharacterized protein n=1 Tax=Roseateles terrae TaxID=431060 RepID=A0ABR6GPF2_9BURK|nr:hypothetical protein [Roseateles terrae]
MSGVIEQRKRRGRPARLDPDYRGQLVSLRVSGAERRAKLKRPGREWLQQAIDAAKEPN